MDKDHSSITPGEQKPEKRRPDGVSNYTARGWNEATLRAYHALRRNGLSQKTAAAAVLRGWAA
jgi:hypothetical protein